MTKEAGFRAFGALVTRAPDGAQATRTQTLVASKGADPGSRRGRNNAWFHKKHMESDSKVRLAAGRRALLYSGLAAARPGVWPFRFGP